MQVIIVSDQEKVIGVLNPSNLIISDDSQRLSNLVVQTPIVDHNDSIYDLGKQLTIDGTTLWFPVVMEGKVLGALSIVSIVNALREQSLQAIVPENVKSEEDLFTPLHVAARLRAIWLIITCENRVRY